MSTHKPMIGTGPFRTHHVREGDRYELVDGHAVYCAPSGGAHARASILGAQVLGTDPLIESAGFDAGYTTDEMNLRAPDIAVGNVPDAFGWIKGVPPLAVEYASTGQDEQELQAKIGELLEGGTQLVWVVRMIGPRRVEVYAKDAAMVTVGPGQTLTAPGILQNPVAVEALYEPSAARDATLRNLLQEHGYNALDEVRAESREEGAVDQARGALLAAIEAKGWHPSPPQAARISDCADLTQLRAWLISTIQSADLQTALGT